MARRIRGQPKVLVVDDEPDLLELLELTLSRMGLDTSCAESVADAIRLLDKEPFDLCLTDMRLPDGSGLEIIGQIAAHHPDTPVAMITAFGNVEAAVEALKAGAFDFVSKPVDLNILRDLVKHALDLNQRRRDGVGKIRADAGLGRLGGDSPAMQALRDTIAKVARSQAPISISGESGVGKELVARTIHAEGGRASGPFVPVNCGAIPAELMESEFFGHKKGSFTGAHVDKAGLFQAADGGTLFLDEIGDMPVGLQTRLLRVLEEQEVIPLGTETALKVDLRVICASHQNLRAMIARGEFREDLYYRLNGITLELPPLALRTDKERLIREFLAAETSDSRPAAIEVDAFEQLLAYRWPGNVRELRNVIRTALAICDGGVVRLRDLPSEVRDGNSAQKSEASAQVQPPQPERDERAELLRCLRECDGNMSLAAKKLGVSRNTLYRRCKRLDIAPQRSHDTL